MPMGSAGVEDSQQQHAPPGDPGGACCRLTQSPFCLRLRDQISAKVSPSSTRLA